MKKFLFVGALACTVAALGAKDPNFSLKNKADFDIFVQLEPSNRDDTDDNIKLFPDKVTYTLNDITNDRKPQRMGEYTLSFGKPVRLKAQKSMALTLDDTTKTTKNGILGKLYRLDIWFTDNNGKPKQFFTPLKLQTNGTFYVKLQMDKKHGLYSILRQEGGLFGKTTEGYSLKNNVIKGNLNPHYGVAAEQKLRDLAAAVR